MAPRTVEQWEAQFKEWSRPPGKTEEIRMQNAEQIVKNAIARSAQLKGRSIKTFVQGSYRNNTNIPAESDVDVAVVCSDVFFEDYPAGTTRQSFGNVAGTYAYPTFKNEVGAALIDYLGANAVKRGNKAFDIKETTYHVDADAAPFFEHRRYNEKGEYWIGVELRPDNGQPERVINWPDQHYENGVEKNNTTGWRYKSLVRINKNLRNEMDDAGIAAARAIPRGFLLECVLWNVPDALMMRDSLYEAMRSTVAYVYQQTTTDALCNDWREVSGMKWLFRPTQPWTRQQVNAFALAAWSYIGFTSA